MALSSLTLTAAGAGPYSLAGLDYLSTAHLAVTVNGVPATVTFNALNRSFSITSAVTAGQAIVVQRTTPRLPAERLTQFLNLASGAAGLTAALLDQDYRQNMLIMGEGRDAQNEVSQTSGLAHAVGGHWNALSKRVEFVSSAVANEEMVNKGQLDAVVAASPANLPAVSGADNDDGLFVVGGAWAKRTPVQARTHLGLGTVATLTSGNGASQVPVLDGSAFYPALDGRNIDLTQNALNTEIGKRARTTIVHLRRGGGFTPAATLSSTWSQLAGTRVAMNSPGTATRTELDAGSGELDDNFTGTSSHLHLAAGTWRLEWSIRCKNTTGGGTDMLFGFKVTDAVDSASQVVHYDIGDARIFSTAGNEILSFFSDGVVVAGSSAFDICFRMANRSNNSLITVQNFTVLAHKVSTAFTFS